MYLSFLYPFGALCPWHMQLGTLPQQDNHCDCGLYTLAYMEFFCHAAPT